MQEILVVIAIILVIFFVPRLMRRNSSSGSGAPTRLQSTSGIKQVFQNGLPGWVRLVIVISVLWIAACAAYMKPWENNSLQFFCIALGPVLALWGGLWVWAGYVKYRR